MKDKKLHDALWYFEERTKFLDPSASCSETSRFVGPNGDFSSLRFDIIPFEGITSVKQVFDALLFYFFSMEISISEVLDDIQVEINMAMFCKYFGTNEKIDGSGGGRESGVIVADFVSEDELYPYSPSTCLRHNVTVALTVMLESRKVVNALGEEREEHVVVLTRTGLLSLWRTPLAIPAHEMQELLERVEGWGDAVLKTARGIVYPRSSISSRTKGTFSPVNVRD